MPIRRIAAMGKRTRFAVVAVAAVLVLGACHWGTYSDRGSGTYVVMVHQANSNDTIAQCANTNAEAEANCALDVIRYACHTDGLPGWTTSECDAATEHFYWACANNNGGPQNCNVSMRSAISAVDGAQECLGFEDGVGGPSRQWFGADAGGGGFAGCP